MIKDNPSVVILAAGQGTRMKSAKPKVLHTLCGKEMIYYCVKEAKKLSDDVTVVLFYEADAIKQCVASEFEGVTFVTQDHLNFPGTAGAVMASAPKNGYTLVLNGDMPLVEHKNLAKLFDHDADIVMSAIRLDDGSGYGRVMTDGEKVTKIVEEKDASIAEKAVNLVNAGVYLFKTGLLFELLPQIKNKNAQGEYYLTDIVEMAVEKGQGVRWVEVAENEFKGINTKRDLAYAEEMMSKRIKERWMREGIIMRLPQTIYIEEGVQLIGECEIEPGVVIKGKSVIESSLIKAHSVIEDGHIKESVVGPFARVRPGTVMTAAHIGNFVEVKNSTLANGVKANHLSYIGDAEVGEGTNIGAGTITCNYDGVNKYKTIIGKNVFIGSDTQLVAPVKVGDGAMVAAGTTVTKDVSAGSLALSRVDQRQVEGFAKRFFEKKKLQKEQNKR